MNVFKNKAKLKGLIRIILILLAVAGIYLWENYGRQEVTYTDIIVFKADIGANVIVDMDMLGSMKIESSTLIDEVVTDPNKIIGKETNTYIPAKLPLSEKFFSNPELTTGDGKYTFKLPKIGFIHIHSH